MEISEADISCLPEKRIQWKTGKIYVGNTEFLSASEALFAYLQQFDGKPRTRKQQEAYELLVTRTKMAARRTRTIEDEVKENLSALRLKKMKQLLHKKKKETGLRKDVEDALSRSAELLEHINDSTTSPVQCASDIGSMSTDLLLTVNPHDTLNRGVTVDEDGKRRHIYSYHTPRSRTRSVPLKFDASRRSSVDSVLPSSVLKQMSKRSSSSGVSSRHSDPNDVLKRLRSRSASPLPLSLRNPLLTSHVRDFDESSGKSVPSWVKTLDVTSDDTMWSHRHPPGGRSAPSWIVDVDKSDITADSLLLNGRRREQSFINKSNLTDSRPGLNFSDLATSGISRYSDKHNILSSHKDSQYDNQIQSPNSSGFKVYSTLKTSEEKLSDWKRLANEGTQLTNSLDMYLERLEAETKKGSPSKGSDRHSHLAPGPKCSSMEIASNLTDGHLKSDVTGASTILKDSNIRPVVSDDEPVTPARVRFSPSKPRSASPGMYRSPSTDLILDGDRPWEQTGAYKSPVYVDEKKHIANALRSPKKTPSPTLTGRDQPGSMEALKNMLFRLQAEESSTDKSDSVDTDRVKPPLDLPALQDYNFHAEPGGESLEKALVHLSRLKTLVHAAPPSDSASTVTMTTSITPSSAITS